ncbi:carbonic anhydrase-like [Amblyomma americanum]
MKPLRFRGHTVPLHNFTLDNDGLTLSLRASPADKTKRTVSGGPLPGTYVFHHALFHWGSGPGHGSEHRIDGVAYPMESQLVYTNQKYAAANATTKEDGLAIIATLYRLTFVNFDSVKTVRGILAALEGNATRARRRLLPWMVRRVVSRRGSSDANAPLPPRLDKLMPPVARHEFFTYRGSLTTPPCTESVRWTVFHRPAFVSEAVLTGFRRLQGRPGRGPLVDNFRPPQKLYGRKIVSSFPPF